MLAPVLETPVPLNWIYRQMRVAGNHFDDDDELGPGAKLSTLKKWTDGPRALIFQGATIRPEKVENWAGPKKMGPISLKPNDDKDDKEDGDDDERDLLR